MTQLAANLVNGVVLGCVYAGFALGLSLLFGILGIVNVAHSAVLVLGALIYWELVNALGLDPLLAVVPVMLLFFGFGLALHRTFMRRLEREVDSTVLLVFFGVLVVIESFAVMVWTTDTRTVRLSYLETTLRFAGINVPAGRLVAAALTLVLFAAAYLFLTRTLTGAAIRGMAQNRDVAEMAGIPVRRLNMLVFASGAALAAYGGTVLGLSVPFSPQEHMRWLAWSFLIVIIGGLGNVGNTLLAGIALGVLESFLGRYLSFQFTYLAIYLLLAAVLLARREGLRGAPARSL